MNGQFIVFEGIDGAGKTTLAKYLWKELNKRRIKTKFVPTTGFGHINKVTEFLIEHKNFYDPYAHFLLSSANNRMLEKTVINPFIPQGENIILDRYYFSSLAYSIPSNLQEKWMMDQISIFRRPDFVFFIDVLVQTAYERKEKIRDIESGYSESAIDKGFLNFQQQVSSAYLHFFEILDIPFFKIDNNRSIEDSKEQIMQSVTRLFLEG